MTTDQPEPPTAATPSSWRASVPTPTTEMPRVEIDDAPAAYPPPGRPRRRVAWGGIVVLILALAALIGGVVVLTQQFIEYRRDPGAQACRAMADAHHSGADLDQAQIASQFAASRSEYLRQASEIAHRAADRGEELTFDQLGDAIADVVTYSGLIGAGCMEVGVRLPPGMFHTT